MQRIIPSPRNGKAPIGVWADGIYDIPDLDGMRRCVERMVHQGVDILFPVFKDSAEGTTWYPSTVATQAARTRGRDPLADLAKAAREFGLKIHPFFGVFLEGKQSRLLNAHPELQAIQNHPVKGLQSDHPEMWGESFRWACTNREEVLEYEFRMIADMLDRYDVDGFQFDFIRTGYHQCYCAYCQAKCKELTGADLLTEMGNFHPLAHRWYEYRAQNITSLVRRVATHAHRLGKATSGDVFCVFPLSYNEQGQEWPLWLKEGYLNLAIPMTYSTIPAETHYYTINHAAQHRAAGRGEFWQGLYAEPVDGELLRTLTRTALESGASGVSYFLYASLTDEKWAAIQAGIAEAQFVG